MAKKRFSQLYTGGEKPSSTRTEEVKKAAESHDQKVEETQRLQKKQEVMSRLDKKKEKLKYEIDKIKNKIGGDRWTGNTTITVQVDLAKSLQFASVEYGLSQKELVTIGMNRLLEDLAKESDFLKMHMI